MNLLMHKLAAWMGLVALLLGLAAPAQAAAGAETGFIALAADRGFQGNEEIRDAFEAFAQGRNAELVVVTDARTQAALQRALARLGERGARRALVLPVFLSEAEPKWQQVRPWLQNPPLPLTVAPVFGRSYFAVEALAEALRIPEHAQHTRVLVASSASGPSGNRALEQDLQQLAERAAQGLGLAAANAVVWYDSAREASRRALAEAAASALKQEHTLVVPFHLGRRLDGMMSFDAELRQSLPDGAAWASKPPAPEPWLTTWMEREANRFGPLAPREVGVILLAHGSDFHWNETMREAVRPLEARHPVEYVFSMADQPLIERAVHRLQRRGARAAVIVRVFGLESSFKSDVERMIGADVEGNASPQATATMHGHHEHHGHGDGPALPPPRIRSPLAMTTVGGLDAHPLFAAALLDRARALSADPAKDTVILVAHGTGDDQRNEQWLAVLRDLAAQMNKGASTPFRAVRWATWREDWPDQRGPWVRKVREMVEQARKDGGRALVIPARTNGKGPERRFLEGLQFELGEGFAPHPLFLRWFEAQVAEGTKLIGPAPEARQVSHAH
ncbi:MAG: cobalamin biosynthesis protein CbiX [Pseudomonadota bacterium]